MEEIKKVQNKLDSLLGEMRELCQPRSDYALEHFVVGQHDTPAAQRKQVLDELYSLMFTLADLADEVELTELEVTELQKQLYELREQPEVPYTQERRLVINIEKTKRKIVINEIALEGRLRECKTLLAMLDEIPSYTKEQYEAEEPLRWELRLTRQFALHQMNDAGNLDAIRQMLTKVGEISPQPMLQFKDLKGLINNDTHHHLPDRHGN